MKVWKDEKKPLTYSPVKKIAGR